MRPVERHAPYSLSVGSGRQLARMAVVAGVLLLGGCATAGYPELPAVAASGASGASAPFDYRIGPGDQLEIFVWGYEDLSTGAIVRPDGRITTRLVEDLQASGRTPTELARDIEARYADFVNEPVVTVGVAGVIGSASQQIRVVNGDGEAQSVPYRPDMTVLDLLVAIGGLGEFASGNRTLLVRGAGDERTTYRVRAADLLGKADMSANAPLAPGDIIIIPQSWF